MPEESKPSHSSLTLAQLLLFSICITIVFGLFFLKFGPQVGDVINQAGYFLICLPIGLCLCLIFERWTGRYPIAAPARVYLICYSVILGFAVLDILPSSDPTARLVYVSPVGVTLILLIGDKKTSWVLRVFMFVQGLASFALFLYVVWTR